MQSHVAYSFLALPIFSMRNKKMILSVLEVLKCKCVYSNVVTTTVTDT